MSTDDLISSARKRAKILEEIEERVSARIRASNVAITYSKRVIEDTARRLEELRSSQ